MSLDAYDEVIYPNFAFPQTHPDRLASLATLFGMTPAPLDDCRVLELGCGDGGNLIPMAFSLPGARFVGIDRAEKPIEKGVTTITALGLRNIELRKFDINGLSVEFGSFDYIIAHGLYSWVPDEIRDRLLHACRSMLAPHGVAYISYNTYPGCHLRNVARELMRFHTKDVVVAGERVVQGRALMNWLATSRPVKNVYHALLADLSTHLNEKNEAAIHHDDLAVVNTPVYFHQFVEHAAQHGLQFLSEADYLDVQYAELPDGVREQMQVLSENDPLAREQYLDFLEGRSFRQSLLCHCEVAVDRHVKPERIKNLFLRADVRPLSAEPDLAAGSVEEFEGKKEGRIATDLPSGKAALLRLGETYPGSVPFEELVSSNKGDADSLAMLLVKAHGAGVVEVHSFNPEFASTASDRPLAHPLARLQAADGTIVTTLLHNNVRLEDDLSRQLLLLLDGHRTRDDILQELKTPSNELDEKLTQLAKLGLLLE